MCKRSRSDGENEDFRHPPDLFLGSTDPDGTEEAPFFVPFGPDSDLEFSMAEGGASRLELLGMRSNGGSRGTGMRARTGGEEGGKILRYLFTPMGEKSRRQPTHPFTAEKAELLRACLGCRAPCGHFTVGPPTVLRLDRS